MLEAPCPQCGAPLHFRSAGLPVIVCAFCRSTVMRHGETLSRVGESAALAAAVSPLCLGAEGRDRDDRFALIGSIRWLWGATPENDHVAQGSWTEWLMLYADGRHGWLAEAGGRLMVSRRLVGYRNNGIVRALVGGKAVGIGTDSTLASINFKVADARPAVSAGCEGELPFAAPAGETLYGVDLVSRNGDFASIQRHGKTVSVYLGRYVRLRDLDMVGLTTPPGWTPPAWAAP